MLKKEAARFAAFRFAALRGRRGGEASVALLATPSSCPASGTSAKRRRTDGEAANRSKGCKLGGRNERTVAKVATAGGVTEREADRGGRLLFIGQSASPPDAVLSSSAMPRTHPSIVPVCARDPRPSTPPDRLAIGSPRPRNRAGEASGGGSEAFERFAPRPGGSGAQVSFIGWQWIGPARGFCASILQWVYMARPSFKPRPALT